MEKTTETPSWEKFLKLAEKTEKLDNDIRKSLQSVDKYYHDKCKEGYYPYIPYCDYKTLYELFSLILETKNPKFIDIGAGTGRIVKLAKFMGIDARGLEYSNEYVTMGREIFHLSATELFQKDAFDLDYIDLEGITIIYTYMPIRENDLMMKLHMHLFRKAPDYTVFVEMLPKYYPMGLFWGNPAKINEWTKCHFAVARKQFYY